MMIYAHELHEGVRWNNGARIKWNTISNYLAGAAAHVSLITGLPDVRYTRSNKQLLFPQLYNFSLFVSRNEKEVKSATPVGPQFYTALGQILHKRDISEKLRRSILLILLSFHLLYK